MVSPVSKCHIKRELRRSRNANPQHSNLTGAMTGPVIPAPLNIAKCVLQYVKLHRMWMLYPLHGICSGIKFWGARRKILNTADTVFLPLKADRLKFGGNSMIIEYFN